MAPGISFGHFNIVGGDVREDGPYVAVMENRTPADTVADLYLVLEPALPGSETFCPELLRLVDRHFGRSQYSLTGNLLQALRAIQEHLRAWNKTCPAEQHASVGASCLAISGAEAYLAQAGPSVAYIRHSGHLRRIEPLEPESQAPLGTRIACSPHFSRFELSQGDTLLLISSRFSLIAGDETIDLILSLPPGEALRETYQLAHREPEFSALYLAVTGALQRDLPAEAESESAESDAVSYRRQEHDDRAYSQRKPAQDLHRSNTLPARSAADAGYGTGFTGTDAWQASPPHPSGGSPALEGSAERRKRQLERLTAHHSIVPPRPAVYAIAVVLALSLAGWLGVPYLLKTGRTDRFGGLVHDAQARLQSASGAQTPAQKRALLNSAQADLDEAGVLRPQDPQLSALKRQAAGQLKALNAVHQLPTTHTLLDLSATQVAPQSVTDFIAGTSVYLLDSSTGKVYEVNPTAPVVQPKLVFSPGKLIENVTTGHARNLAWQPPAGGNTGLLYVLDGNRRLFSVDSSGTARMVGLAGAAQWKSAIDMTVAGGDLYVLDSVANQIWRYTPSAGGFTSQPQAIAPPKTDLQNAISISVIGAIYISTQSGHLLRIGQGAGQPVTLSGIDRPMVSPGPPLLDPVTGLLYIADAGNDRIVVADQSGAYREQYTGAALQGLRAIALDASSGTLYALSGQDLVVSHLR